MLDSLYANAAVFVNPVICGAGSKNQADTSAAGRYAGGQYFHGNGRDGVRTFGPSSSRRHAPEFAACVRKLIVDRTLAESLVRNAQVFLREKYAMKANMQKTLSEILETNKQVAIAPGIVLFALPNDLKLAAGAIST